MPFFGRHSVTRSSLIRSSRPTRPSAQSARARHAPSREAVDPGPTPGFPRDGNAAPAVCVPPPGRLHRRAPRRVAQPLLARPRPGPRPGPHHRSAAVIRGERIEGTSKNGRSRTVSVDAETVHVMRDHRRRQAEDRLIDRDTGQEPSEDVARRVADENAVLAFGLEDADCGPDEIGRGLHHVRVGNVAADDQCDVCGEVVHLETGADGCAGVVADGRCSPAWSRRSIGNPARLRTRDPRPGRRGR